MSADERKMMHKCYECSLMDCLAQITVIGIGCMDIDWHKEFAKIIGVSYARHSNNITTVAFDTIDSDSLHDNGEDIVYIVDDCCDLRYIDAGDVGISMVASSDPQGATVRDMLTTNPDAMIVLFKHVMIPLTNDAAFALLRDCADCMDRVIIFVFGSDEQETLHRSVLQTQNALSRLL